MGEDTPRCPRPSAMPASAGPLTSYLLLPRAARARIGAGALRLAGLLVALALAVAGVGGVVAAVRGRACRAAGSRLRAGAGTRSRRGTGRAARAGLRAVARVRQAVDLAVQVRGAGGLAAAAGRVRRRAALAVAALARGLGARLVLLLQPELALPVALVARVRRSRRLLASGLL